MIIHRLYPKLAIYGHTDDMDYPSPAMCYDCGYLMSLIWSTTSLSYDEEGMVNITGHGGVMTVPQLGYWLFATVFVLAVGNRWDDATSDEDQWTVFRHVTP